MVEAVITNLEIPDHDEEELEPLESPPPAPMILCCEWLLLKMCGYSREERDTEHLHHSDTGARSKRKL